MNEQLKWVLELVNRVTGPARQIQDSIKNVTASAEKLKQASGDAQSGVSSLSGSFASLSSGVALGQMAASVLSSIASAAWEASKALAKSALEAAAFKETTLIGLGVLLKSETQAKAVYKEAEAFAAKTPFNTQDVLKLYQQLITSGFSIEKNAQGLSEVSALAETIGNAAAAQGMSPETIGGITKAIGDIKAKGKLSAQELLQLSNWGVGRMPIYEQLAKAMNKKVEDIPKMLEQGQIDSAMGINAVVAAIGGNFGNLMNKQSNTLTGLWSTLASRPFEILSSLSDTEAFDTLKELVYSLGELFSPTGSAAGNIQDFLKNVIKGLFDTLFGWAKDAQGKITPASLQAGIKKLSDWFTAAYERVEPLIFGIGKLVMTLVDAFAAIERGSPTLNTFGAAWSVLSAIVVAFMATLNKLIQIGQALSGVVFAVANVILEVGKVLVDAWQAFWDSAYRLGEAIWQGLVDGIKSAPGAVAGAVTDLASDAYDSATTFLGIRSPSKVFREIGQFTALGMAQGIEAGAGRVHDAAMSMVSIPNYAAAGASFAAGSSGAPGGETTNKPSVTLNITINGQTNPEQIQETKDQVVTALSEAFEGLGWELGIAPK